MSSSLNLCIRVQPVLIPVITAEVYLKKCNYKESGLYRSAVCVNGPTNIFGPLKITLFEYSIILDSTQLYSMSVTNGGWLALNDHSIICPKLCQLALASTKGIFVYKVVKSTHRLTLFCCAVLAFSTSFLLFTFHKE